ncbi:MAG: PDZ domain-containing protein [Zavarzinella sp.]
MKKIILMVLMAGWTTALFAQSDGPPITVKSNDKFIDLFRTVVKDPSVSVYRLQVDDKNVALATAVTKDGYLVTKASELGDAVKLNVISAKGEKLTGLVTAKDEIYDLALIKIKAKDIVPIQFAKSEVGLVGNWVAAVSNGDKPAGVGVISVATRDLPPPYGMRRTPTANSGFLGIQLNVEAPNAQISSVTPDSAAAKAGLLANDVILKVDATKITNGESLINTLLGTKAGQTIELTIERETKVLVLKATLGARPKELLPKGKSRGDIQNSMGSKLSERRNGFPIILQHDIVIAPEDCGGPLVDLDGNVLGINIARAGRTESYAIPSETVQKLLPDMIKSSQTTYVNEAVAEAQAAVKAAENALKDAESARTAAMEKLKSAQNSLEEAMKLKASLPSGEKQPTEDGPTPRLVPKK